MRRKLLIATIGLVLLVRVPVSAEDFLVGLFGQYLDALRRQVGVPGLVAAIAGEDDILWERAFGVQDLERGIATRGDTPFHLDGLTQIFTSALILRCAEEGRLSLDDRVARFEPDSPEAGATLRELLTHTTRAENGSVFAYDLDRLDPLMSAVRTCTDGSYRKNVSTVLKRFAMRDSVPGPDAPFLVPPAAGIPEPEDAERYVRILERLATPYAVDKRGRATPSEYTVTTLRAGSGLISSVRDLGEFDIALRKGQFLRDESLEASWRTPEDRLGRALPHGLGWFVQIYKGELVAWQFGVSDRASSSLVIKLPRRRITFVALANSDGLVRPFPLGEGDLTVSPVGRLFLRFFVG